MTFRLSTRSLLAHGLRSQSNRPLLSGTSQQLVRSLGCLNGSPALAISTRICGQLPKYTMPTGQAFYATATSKETVIMDRLYR
jgi:hypothetical protein